MREDDMEKTVDEGRRELHHRALADLERDQDANVEERRVLERVREDIEGFYAWSERWRGECEEMSPADAHSRMLLESLSASARGARAEGEAALAGMAEENRLEGLRLSMAREDLARAREGSGEGE